MDHYIALPKGKGPGLVLLQEIFGVNRPMRSIADTWAKEGFVTMVPDLFWRLEPNVDLMYGEEDWKHAIDLMNRFDVEKGLKDLSETMEKVKAHPQCNGKVYVIGFCLGGLLAYLVACRYPVDGAVSFYGVKIDEHLDKKPKCPVLFHYGMEDSHISSDRIERVKAAFGDAVSCYPNTGHGFYNRDRAEYSKKAAEEAHQQTLKFLAKF